MTRKDYEKFAEMLKATRPTLDSCYGEVHYSVLKNCWDGFVSDVSRVFLADNANFNTHKFISKCNEEKDDV